MDMSALNPVAIAVALIVAATPLVFAAIGELVVEKAGVLNLGVEGMMIVGAIAGFAFTQETGSTTVGVLAALIAGALLAALFAFMTQVLMSNQVATGLALTLFGLGLAAMIGQPYSGIPAPPFPELAIPGLSSLPVIGPLLFAHDWLVYASLVLTAGVWDYASWWVAVERCYHSVLSTVQQPSTHPSTSQHRQQQHSLQHH